MVFGERSAVKVRGQSSQLPQRSSRSAADNGRQQRQCAVLLLPPSNSARQLGTDSVRQLGTDSVRQLGTVNAHRLRLPAA
jgi:hypothetical protein